jgi:hypothetical protein
MTNHFRALGAALPLPLPLPYLTSQRLVYVLRSHWHSLSFSSPLIHPHIIKYNNNNNNNTHSFFFFPWLIGIDMEMVLYSMSYSGPSLSLSGVFEVGLLELVCGLTLLNVICCFGVSEVDNSFLYADDWGSALSGRWL